MKIIRYREFWIIRYHGIPLKSDSGCDTRLFPPGKNLAAVTSGNPWVFLWCTRIHQVFQGFSA
jgi:hypothetical protein